MRVSTITPARNDGRDLGGAIDSILAQQGATIDEIVIAVGPSTDDTARVAADLAAEHPVITVVGNPSGRTPDALNAAIAATTGEVVVRVDARAVLPPNYVADALETLEQTGAGNVGAIQRPVGHATVERGIAAAMRSRLGTGGAAYRGATERQAVDTAWLGVFRRDALDAVGGYDAEFTRNQDAELNIRLNAAGHQVWLDPRLVVDYRPRPSLPALARQYYEYGWWRLRTARKHPGTLALRQVAAPAIVVGLVTTVAAAPATPVALVVPAAYLGVVGASALAAGGPLAERAATAAALGTMHVSWGVGFLASAVSAGQLSQTRRSRLRGQ